MTAEVSSSGNRRASRAPLMAAFDFTDPAVDAYCYAEAVADGLGDDAVDAYFCGLVDELFVLVPGLRKHFADALLGELKEEVARKEDPKHSRAVVALIEDIENEWRQQS